MYSLHSRSRTWASISSTVLIGILCEFTPARAQPTLEFLTPNRDPEGAVTEFSTPLGYSCRYQSPDKPTLTFGAGVTPVLRPGLSSVYGFTQPDVGTEPVVGVSVRIPFGSNPENCDEIIKIETSNMKLQKAMEMFEIGLITKEQLDVISAQAYAVLLD